MPANKPGSAKDADTLDCHDSSLRLLEILTAHFGGYDSEPLLERGQLLAKCAGVIGRVAHNFFYVITSFAKRDGFRIDCPFQRLRVAPLPCPAGACVVGSRSQQGMVVG